MSETWPATTLTMKASQTMNNNGIHVLRGVSSVVLDVPRNHKLVVAAGSILKFIKTSALVVRGDLQIQGTASAPVTLTSICDDIRSDTNKDGSATKPKPGDWRGILFQRYSDASVIAHAVIAYGGQSSTGAVNVSLAGPIFRNTTFTRSPSHGVVVGSMLTARPTFENCAFSQNNGVALLGIPWDSVGKSFGNVASNNTGGDYFQVGSVGLRPNTGVDIRTTSYPGTAIVLGSRPSISNGSRLTLHDGVTVKMTAGGQFSVGSKFECLGTGQNPVRITSIHDDSIGGDTNKNGSATSAAAGDWPGISFGTTASGLVQHTLLRYPGRSSNHGIMLNNDRVTLVSVRIDQAGLNGIFLWGHNGPLNNTVIYKAGGVGIQIVLTYSALMELAR